MKSKASSEYPIVARNVTKKVPAIIIAAAADIFVHHILCVDAAQYLRNLHNQLQFLV